MNFNQFLCVVCAFMVISFAPPIASADIVFTFSESATGGVDVVGTGSGFVSNTQTGAVQTRFWDVDDFDTDFLVDTFTLSQTSSDSISGFFTNVTTGQSHAFESFAVDRDPDTEDDLDIRTVSQLNFAEGQEYSFSMAATFEPTTLAFSDLIVGTHIDLGRTQGGGLSVEVFGITTVSVVSVPEPATLSALLLASAFIAGRRRRR